MSYRRAAMVLIGLFLVLAPAAAAWAQGPLAAWTVLVYLDGDNNLEDEGIDDFLEMAAAGSNPAVNVVVQFDRIPGYDQRYGDWTGTLRFRVMPGMTPEPRFALADLGEANMGHPQTLSDFIRWGRTAFPAQRTMVILWNHGDGWRMSSLEKERRKAIAWDDTNGRDALDMVELGQALAAGTDGGSRPLDVLAFDACLMAMAEVDDQVRPYAQVRVGSEDTEPGNGYPYDTILNDLFAHPEWDGPALAQDIVERYYQAYRGETQSAVDLGPSYAGLVSTVDALAGALLELEPAQMDPLRGVRRQTQQFYTHNVDLGDLAARLAATFAGQPVGEAAQAVADAVARVVLAERHGSVWPGARGISIYFPSSSSGWDSSYDGSNQYLTFTAATRWDEFLHAYLAMSGTCTPDPYEPDGTPAQAKILETGKAQTRLFCPANDAVDWAAWPAQAGQHYQIATLDLGSECDTVVRLYAPDGQTLLAQDDDSGPGWASLVEWTSPADGTYYVQVIEYRGRTGSDTGYTLRADPAEPRCAPDPYEPDDMPALAAALGVDDPSQERNFCPAGEVDWAAFEAEAGETYILKTHDLGPDVETMLALYDADGETQLLTQEPESGPTSRLEWQAPAKGTYLVQVREAQGRGGPGAVYRLRASRVPLMIEGIVRLQGRTTFGGAAIEVAPAGYTTTTAADGSFHIAAARPCTITASFPGYLPAAWTLQTGEEPTIVLDPVTLLGGDVNGDRVVDILDLAYMGAQFGTTDVRADLNGDGQVNILDLVMAAGNFYRRAGE